MAMWKPIPGHAGYEASDQGEIRSLDRWIKEKHSHKARYFRRGRVLRQYTVNGYKTTHLGIAHINKYVHHLVMLAFVGPVPEGLLVCHNNGKKSDNRLSNLRYDTQFGNMSDAVRHRYEQAWLDYAEDSKQSAGAPRMGEGDD